MVRLFCFAVSALALVTGTAAAQVGQTGFGQTLVPIDPAAREAFDAVRADPRVIEALEQLRLREPATIEEQIRITEIPAPPFMEDERAAYYLEQVRARGLEDAWMDSEGNVIGRRPGAGVGGGEAPILLIGAHLDTVFGPEVDVSVEFRDGRYYAPGIGDDSRGLAVLLAVIEVLGESGIDTVADVLFTGNVGEEGRGDLRGIKAIFRENPEIDGFISVDGVRMTRITIGGTGSRRFEFRFSGPGGHSFGAFGLPSATHAMGRAIAHIAELRTPSYPKTTFTVGTVDGGTSVNSIAADAVFAIDMRSNSPEQLVQLEAEAKAVALAAVAEENARWNNGEIALEFVLIGDRPTGLTPAGSPIVQAAALATETSGVPLRELGISSTDSNVPMALGIPAITMPGGGDGGDAHSPGEWFAPEDSHLGPQTVLLTILALAGIEGVSEPLLVDRGAASSD
ncbi:MAG: M20/M25/M40 family metallo-hydrolase [Gammaproteobacteria bacterium]|nr:M20/M25/M40 family metallo-hydrolase [Gammaproteobacteria bacterium]